MTLSFKDFSILLIIVALLMSVMYVIGLPLDNISFGSPPSSGKIGYTFEPLVLSVAQARIIEVVSGHAWQNHGAEVNKSVDCLRDNGTWKSFKTTGFTDSNGSPIDTNLWLCTDGKDFFAIVTTKFYKEGGNLISRLVTAYKVSKDIFPVIDDFIDYIAVKWGAYEINYIIQAGSDIFLSPQ